MVVTSTVGEQLLDTPIQMYNGSLHPFLQRLISGLILPFRSMLIPLPHRLTQVLAVVYWVSLTLSDTR